MEFVDGGNMFQYIKQRGSLHEDEGVRSKVQDIANQLAFQEVFTEEHLGVMMTR